MHAANQLTIDHSAIQSSADQASNLMKVLANPDRLLLLCQLSAGEKSVGELENTLNIRQPTLSQQLTVLRENKVVSTRREGKNIYYNIASDSVIAIMGVLSQQLCKLGKNAKSAAPTITKHSQTFSCCPQIVVDDVAKIATLGFKSIINCRPDNEGGSEQPMSKHIESAAKKAGLHYAHIPVVPGNITDADINKFSAFMASAKTPVLGFCKTGNRASTLYQKSQTT